MNREKDILPSQVPILNSRLRLQAHVIACFSYCKRTNLLILGKGRNYSLHHHLFVVEGKGGEFPTFVILLLHRALPSLSSCYRKGKDLHSLQTSSFCYKGQRPPFHIVILLLLLLGTRTLKGEELPHLHHLLVVKRWSHHLFFLSFLLFLMQKCCIFIFIFLVLFYLWLILFFKMYIYALSYLCFFLL